MIYLLLSIVCSVSVGVLFKLTKPPFVSLLQILFFGYITSFGLSVLFFNPNVNIPYGWKYRVIILILSVIMPTAFFALKKSVVENGIVKTDMVQRLSLFLPIIASFFIFKEEIKIYKLIAVIIAFLSIYLIMDKGVQKVTTTNNSVLLYIFVVYGAVDILFKTITNMPFKDIISIVFLGCSVFMLVYNIYKRSAFNGRNLLIGVLLGGLNFTNIYSYVLAHKMMQDKAVVVFTSMNLGVIFLGTLIGVFFLKEKISVKNYIGLTMAVLSILLLFVCK